MEKGRPVEFRIDRAGSLRQPVFLVTESAPALLQPSTLQGGAPRAFARSTTGDSALVLTIVPPPQPYLYYSVWREVRPAISITALNARRAAVRDSLLLLTRELSNHGGYRDLLSARKGLRSLEDRLREEGPKNLDGIAVLGEQARAFLGMDSEAAAVRIGVLQDRADRIRQAQEALEGERRKAAVRVDTVLASLDDSTRSRLAAMQRLEREGKELQTRMTCAAYVALSSGVLFLDDRDVALYYDLLRDEKQNPKALAPIGRYPVMAAGDHVSAIVANWQPGRDPGGFQLKVNGQLIVSQNEPIVRIPRVIAEAALLPPRRGCPGAVEVTPDTWSQYVLVFPAAARGNERFEVSVFTVPRSTDSDAKAVTILDKEILPVVRARYRFAIAPGLVYLFRSDRSFTKVKVVEDDPQTSVGEARYRVDSRKEEDGLIPVLTLGTYLRPTADPAGFDAHRSASPGRPSLLLGFDLKEPGRNYLFGVSLEPTANLEVVGGIGLGRIRSLQTRNEISEAADPSPPATREVWVGKPFIGATFNLDFLTRAFGKL